jgi:lysozyme
MGKPQISRERVLEILQRHGVDLMQERVALVGIRGYFLNSMGKKGKNDIGIWDDGFTWIARDGSFATFNGNTDPSRYYLNVATLKTGLWRYKTGIHPLSRPGGYPAFRQAGNVMVMRYKDGKRWQDDLGDFGINIHRGGASTTSSAGCQTLPPDQWDAFKTYGYMLLDRFNCRQSFPYLLVENDGSIA